MFILFFSISFVCLEVILLILCVIPFWDSAPTQQQITHPLLKSSTLPLRKMPVFQCVAPWHTILPSPCFISLWTSATDHSPCSKELNPFSQEDAHFSGRCTLAYNFHLILLHYSLGLSNRLFTL